MIRTQVYLSESDRMKIAGLRGSMRQSASQIIRLAIREYSVRHEWADNRERRKKYAGILKGEDAAQLDAARESVRRGIEDRIKARWG